MDLILIFLPALISVLVLYLLNRVFRYKDKLVNILGIVKYKISVLILYFIILYIIIFKYNISISQSPIALSIMFPYIYLVAVYKKSG